MNNDDPIPKRVDKFDIVRRIGTGGLGAVYETRQFHHNLRIALKLISSEHGLMTKAIHCLQREIALTSRLDHPHIVPVFSTGEFALVAYIAMEFVAGPNVDQIIRGLKLERAGYKRAATAESSIGPADHSMGWALDILSGLDSQVPKNAADGTATQAARAAETGKLKQKRFRKIAEMTADVADALAYAHAKGVVHRDIKPSNLLLAPDGRLRLSDFGLASILLQPGMTLYGALPGSPMYTSPEQITANAKHTDHRTDVYSLGAVLFEWLALRPPFGGQQRDQLVSQIIYNDPPPLRRIDRQIPRALQTICAKAMEKDPVKRYQTADQMADDLRRFVSNRRIKARAVGPIERNARWLNKRPAVGAALLLGLMATGALGTVAFKAYQVHSEYSAQQLNRDINDAIAGAFAGDQVVPITSMEEAHSLGARKWIMALLEGQKLVYSGKAADAIVELERGLKSKPDSLELKTTLGKALLDCGRLDEFKKLQEELATAVPATTREQLYLGSWIAMADPEEGEKVLREAYRISKPELDNLARLFLSAARWRLVLDTFDVDITENSLIEAQFAYYHFRNNSYVTANQFQAMIVACRVLREAGKDDVDELEEEALTRLEELEEAFPESRSATIARGWYAFSIEEPEQRLGALQTAISKYGTRRMQSPTGLREAYALELALNGRMLEAEQELTAIRATGATDMEFLIAIISMDGKEFGIEATQKELESLAGAHGVEALFRPIGLQMLGKTAEAKRLCAQLKSTTEFPAYRRAWHEKVMQFGCGLLNSQELIAAMDEPRVSHFNRSQGHFFIGMQLLSEGKRAEAKPHFEQCLGAQVFPSREYQTARFILKKWEVEPTWPSWIPGI